MAMLGFKSVVSSVTFCPLMVMAPFFTNSRASRFELATPKAIKVSNKGAFSSM